MNTAVSACLFQDVILSDLIDGVRHDYDLTLLLTITEENQEGTGTEGNRLRAR